MNSLDPVLLVDFGSTYTKVAVVRTDPPAVLAQAAAPTTPRESIVVGLRNALARLPRWAGNLRFRRRVATSSAHGGLRMVAIGLVPELTAAAARQAALGAGARLAGVFHGHLDQGTVDGIVALAPDLVLLAGGTDGGNREVLLANARRLAGSALRAPVLVAGNRAVGEEACALLRGGGKVCRLTENVLPRLGELNVGPAREAIQTLFLEQIVHARGLDEARELLDGVLLPTPVAVLRAAALLARGPGGRGGWGELAVVDIGGATTDVHSVAPGGAPPGVVCKGVPEPEEKRTVEADLGMREGAPSLVEAAGPARVAEEAGLPVERAVELAAGFYRQRERLAQTPEEAGFEAVLARHATRLALARHAGTRETLFTPAGRLEVQRGKDLTGLRWLVGTGGIFAYHPEAPAVLRGALAEEGAVEGAGEGGPRRLLPRAPRVAVDRAYLLWAMGLLAEEAPEAAFRLMTEGLLEEGEGQ